MANITKTQFKSILNKLYDEGVLGKLDSIMCDAIEEIESLISDVEEERDNIEPYENKNDLTEKQQERYDWLDELASDLNELKDELDSMQGNLGDYQERLENRE